MTYTCVFKTNAEEILYTTKSNDIHEAKGYIMDSLLTLGKIVRIELDSGECFNEEDINFVKFKECGKYANLKLKNNTTKEINLNEMVFDTVSFGETVFRKDIQELKNKLVCLDKNKLDEAA